MSRTILLRCLLCLCLLGVCLSSRFGMAQTSAGLDAPYPAATLPRYWPMFPRPKTTLRVIRPATEEEYATLMILSGLVARAVQKGETTERIWIEQPNPNAYTLWFQAMVRQTGATVKGPFTTAELIRRFRAAGIVKGYLIYHPDSSNHQRHEGSPGDTSLNVATSLCAPMKGIAVSDTTEPVYRQMGLTRLFDARSISEADCFVRYQNLFNRNVVGMQDPKIGEPRDSMVAMQAFVLSKPGPLYDRVLAWANPDCPILGWGIGDEFEITSHASQQGLFITSTDWCSNLPLLSTEIVGKSFDPARVTSRHPRTEKRTFPHCQS